MYKPIRFAKVIESDGFQVLLKKSKDETDKEYFHTIIQTTVIYDEGAECNISMSVPISFKEEYDRDKAFDEFSKADVDRFIKVITSILNKVKNESTQENIPA